MTKSHRPGVGVRLRRFLSALGIGLGLVSGGGVAGAAQTVSPEAAPAAWIAYAGRVNTAVTGWLGGDEDLAVRVRAHLDATRSAPEQASPAFALKVWVDAAGIVTKIDFPPFATEAANDDVRSLLVGRAVGAPPPSDMLLPLRLAVQLDPPPPAETQTSGQAGQGGVPPIVVRGA